MECSDIPALAKFEEFVLQHADSSVALESLDLVKEIINPAPRPLTAFEMGSDPEQMLKLKASCEAVEKATRVIWACAAAHDQIIPAMWEEVPDFDSALEYFNQLSYLELMAATNEFSLGWEKRRLMSPAQRP
jgi:hypothetical protein